MPRWANPKVVLIAASILAGLLLLPAGVVPGKAHQPAAKPDTPKPGKKQANQGVKYERVTDPSLYVGSETCKTCHEDMPTKDFFKNYESSPHYATTLDTKRGPEWHGCEACHGPGKDHVEGRGDKTKSSPSKTLCLPIRARAAYDVISMTTSMATSTGPLTWQAA